MPNNREWALLFWALVSLTIVVSRRDLRPDFARMLRLALGRRILPLLFGLICWTVMQAWLGYRVGIWDFTLITDTTIWFMTVGVVLFINLENTHKKQNFFRREVAAVIGANVLIEFYVDVYVLSFIAELLLQPLLLFLGILSLVAKSEERTRVVGKLSDALLALGGMLLVVNATVHVFSGWRDLQVGALLRELSLPVWLTVGILPYIYLLGLYAAYQVAFQRIDWKSRNGGRLASKLALMVSFHVKARQLGSFTGPWQMRISSAKSFREARDIISQFRKDWSSSALRG